MPILIAFTDVMFWIYALIVFILVLGIIILIHEGGHFFFARKADILCHEFSIGMGPLVKQVKKGETHYSIRAVPIGGFVSMAGEDTNETILKEEQVIGLNFKKVSLGSLKLNCEDTEEVEAVSEIIMDDSIESTIKGKVKGYDLYSKDGDAMYVEIETEDGATKTFNVCRDAFYIFSQKQKIQLAPYDRCFESKSLGKRFMTVFAGPMMNFILAFLIFIVVGFANGVANTESTVIGDFTADYPAIEAGLEKGDKILSVNDKSCSTWTEFSSLMDECSGETKVRLKVLRGDTEYEFTIPTVIVSYRLGIANFNYLESDYTEGIQVSLVYDDNYVVGKAGLKNGDVITAYYDKAGNRVELSSWKEIINYIEADKNLSKLKLEYKRPQEDKTLGEAKTLETSVWTAKSLNELGVNTSSKTAIGVVCSSHFSFIGGLKNAVLLFWNSITTVFMTLFALFSNSQISVNDLSGPVGIFQAVKAYLGTDFITFLSFVGLISANIGLVNLLPIPALDGGRILFLGIEAVTRKPVNKKVETILNNIVFWLVMILFVYITINDVLKLF